MRFNINMNKEEQRQRLYEQLVARNAANIQMSKKYYKRIKSYMRKLHKDRSYSEFRNSFDRHEPQLCSSPGNPSVKVALTDHVDNIKMKHKTELDLKQSEHRAVQNMRTKCPLLTQSVRKKSAEKSTKEPSQSKDVASKMERKNSHASSQKALLNLKEIVFMVEKFQRQKSDCQKDRSCQNIPPPSQHRYKPRIPSRDKKEQQKFELRGCEVKNFLPCIKKVKEMRMNNYSSIFIKDFSKDKNLYESSMRIEAIPVHHLNWHYQY